MILLFSNDANQDSLDGAQPPVSDVGSAEEFDKDREEDTPSASNGDAEGNIFRFRFDLHSTLPLVRITNKFIGIKLVHSVNP